MPRHTPFGVVLVEDDDVDAESIGRSFRALNFPPDLTVYRSAAAALAALQGPQSQRPPSPFVLVLELHLPGMSGLEFLAHVRQDPQLSGTVVFVLTSSTDPALAAAAYGLGVAGYVRKSHQGGNQCQALVSLIDVYMESVTLPDPGSY